MRKLVDYFVGHRVASNLLMLTLVVGGLALLPSLNREVFPEVQLARVVVQVPYPGATPDEVEDGIVLAVEDAVRGVEGVDEVRATAAEGMAVVSAELLRSADPDDALRDIEGAVDRITSFPREAEEPQIALASRRRRVISLILYGDASEATLRELAERSRARLLANGTVTSVELQGARPPEIHVDVPQSELRRHGLTPRGIAGHVRAASVQVPGGEVEGAAADVLVRTDTRRERGEAIAEVDALVGEDGGLRDLGDIAEVRDEFRDTDRSLRFDGQRAVRLDVYRVGEQRPGTIAQAVRDHVAGLSLPAGVDARVWGDQSQIFDARLSLLLENGALGLALVVLLLGIALEPRVAFWVTVGIPISFVAAFWVLPATGVTLNIISLFAFIVTLGLVVDDAIVVGEAIHHRREHGDESDAEAALHGTLSVGRPVIFAVATTCVAFAPMLFVPGTSGQLFANIPTVVMIVLLGSLVECLLILPAHLAHPMPPPLAWLLTPLLALLGWLGGGPLSRGAAWLRRRLYVPLAKAAVRARLATLAGGVALLALVYGLFAGERIDFRFLPDVEDDEVALSLQMPPGTPAEQVRHHVEAAAEAAAETAASLESGVIEGALTEVGRTARREQSAAQEASNGGHLGAVLLDLGPGGERETSAKAFVEAWRQRFEPPSGARLRYRYAAAAGGGPDIDLEVRHPDREVRRSSAERLAEALGERAGVRDVDPGVDRGKLELQAKLRPEGRRLGLREEDLARQLRSALHGAEALRQQRGREELRVLVRRAESERDSPADLRELLLRTPGGGEVPLYEASAITTSRAPTSIERIGGQRVLHVTAAVASGANANDIVASLQGSTIAELEEEHDALSIGLAGDQEDQRETLSALGTGFAIALFAMYALLALVFESYVQPFVVMAAIPFGTVGGVLAHMAFGYDLSIVSVFGFVALAGVMVNDSLLLVDTANVLRRDEGLSAVEAARRAGARRLRPIVLTSLTTFLGLAPMIFETSVQARFLIPMALSLGFGIVFATFIIVLLVPALYALADDVTRLSGRLSRLFGRARSAAGGGLGPSSDAAGL